MRSKFTTGPDEKRRAKRGWGELKMLTENRKLHHGKKERKKSLSIESVAKVGNVGTVLSESTL